jgi:hypothetical protein
VLHLRTDAQGKRWLQIESDRVCAVPGWATLQQTSRDLIGQRSQPFMLQLLTQPPLSLPIAEAEQLAPSLRYFWAEIADGDAQFDFSHFPPAAQRYFESFGADAGNGGLHLIDNCVTLLLDHANRTWTQPTAKQVV